MEDVATKLAIEESLKMKCQFCAKTFQNHDELQLHQVGDCHVIEAGGRTQPTQDPQSFVTHHNSITTEIARVEIRKSAASTISTTAMTNYRLNETKSLQKKHQACSRDPYHVQQHENNVVITLNTATFEYFSNMLKQYITSCHGYKLVDEPLYDTHKRIVQDRLKVYKQSESIHLYTVNLYRTKCRALINGPSYERFVSHDLGLLEKQIINITDTLDEVNQQMQKAIAECIMARTEIKPKEQPSEKRRQTLVRQTTSERKSYGTRSRSQLFSRAETNPSQMKTNTKREAISKSINPPLLCYAFRSAGR